MKYLLETPIKGTIGSEKYKTAIHWRNGVLTTDEPEKLGGRDLGPDPYTLLLSSIVACTLVTLRMYIERKDLAISEIRVEANMFHTIQNQEAVMRIERKIEFENLLDLEVQQKLMQIAENCPVSKILKGNIDITTKLKE
jgi:putative redox protein